MDRHHIRFLMLGAFVTLTVAIVVIEVRSQNSSDLVLKIEPITASDQITVYAGGAVATPGLYTLPVHARVASLVDQAGLLNSADQTALQMAAELHDGQQVIVPERGARLSTSEASQQSNATSSVTSAALENGPIDVNVATLEQLDSLPGIGPALAQRILDYRTEHGPFATLDDLANVSGISSRTVDALRAFATAGP